MPNLATLLDLGNGDCRPLYLRHNGWDGRRGVISVVPYVANRGGWILDARVEVAEALGLTCGRCTGLQVKVGRRWPGDVAADWLQPRLREALGLPVRVLWII